MFQNSKKGQISVVASALFFILISGILLFLFSPTINDFRVAAINDATSATGDNTLYLLGLYAFMPILWVIYVFLSCILVFVAVSGARGSPI